MHITMKKVVFVNGILDVVCAIGLLSHIYIPQFDYANTTLLLQKYSLDVSPILAYWVFTNGAIRLLNHSQQDKRLVWFTYALEGYVWLQEWLAHTDGTEADLEISHRMFCACMLMWTIGYNYLATE